MLVGPNWKPHKFTDEELDEILRRRPLIATLEEFCSLVCRELGRLTPEERAKLRRTTHFGFTWNDMQFLKQCGIKPEG